MGRIFILLTNAHEQPQALRPTSTRRANGRRVRRKSEVRAIPAADAAVATTALRRQTTDALVYPQELAIRRLCLTEPAPVSCCMRRGKHRSHSAVPQAPAGGLP